MISLLTGLVISRDKISTEFEKAKMQLNKSLVVMFCILRLNFADVMSCSKEVRKNEICLKTDETYVEPYPLALNTTVVLKEIIDIDEKESSITVRVTRCLKMGIGHGHKYDTYSCMHSE